MMPSKSDRKAWLPIAIVLGLLLAISLLAGAGPWLTLHLTPILNQLFRSISLVFAISVVLHVLIWPPFFLLRIALERITGLRLA